MKYEIFNNSGPDPEKLTIENLNYIKLPIKGSGISLDKILTSPKLTLTIPTEVVEHYKSLVDSLGGQFNFVSEDSQLCNTSDEQNDSSHIAINLEDNPDLVDSFWKSINTLHQKNIIPLPELATIRKTVQPFDFTAEASTRITKIQHYFSNGSHQEETETVRGFKSSNQTYDIPRSNKSGAFWTERIYYGGYIF